MGAPTFWLIAGPNGVGKTSFAMRSLEGTSGSINFVNMDEIARGLSPLQPSAAETEAARIALARAGAFIDRRRTFAWETRMSGSTQARFLERASRAGLRTALLYFSAREPSLLLERIARRVAAGGHDVPRESVVRRFHRSLANLPRYLALADVWRVYEASGAEAELALEGRRGTMDRAASAVLARAHPAVAALRST